MVVVGGCDYGDNYYWISQPLYSSPHGGVFGILPQFYQDYEEEIKKAKIRWERANSRREKARQEENARKFREGFFGFSDEEETNTENKKEKNCEDYPYSFFGLKKSDSNEDMKKAYRKFVLKAHPDKGGSAEAFRKVMEAYNYFKQVFL